MERRFVAPGAALLAVVVALLPLGTNPAAAAPAAPAAVEAPAGVQEETFTVGPFQLAPEGQPGDQLDRRFVDMPRPAGDIALRSITWALVDANGDPVPHHDAHLHHIVLMDTARRDALCSFPSAARFASSGMELNDLVLPEPYAYHSPAGAPWQGIYHVMNTSDAPVEVAVQYTIGWTEPTEADKDVDLHFFDVTGCWGTSEYTVPGGGGVGSIHEKTNDYTMDRDGEMVIGGGHLHPHGRNITLDGPDGEVCRSEATYGGGHDPHHGDMEISGCGRITEEFEAGDRYRLTARYDNEHQVLGAMGIMGVYVHFTSPPPPPPPPVTIDVTVSGFSDGALTGTVTCSRSVQAWLDGSVQQQKGSTRPVYGYGYTNRGLLCGPEPTSFSLSITGGSGVLTGGMVQYRVSASAFDPQTGASTWEELEGETRLRGRVDLARTPPDAGPLPITIDRRTTSTVGGQAVTGTVTCDEPQQLEIGLGGHQRVGRHHISVRGQHLEVECDGPTPFTIPISTDDGRLAGGPASVTVWAHSMTSWEEPTLKSSTVLLAGGHATPEPDPDSRLRIDALRRTASGLEATLTYEDCTAGSELYVQAMANRARGGKRLPDSVPWGGSEVICSGGDETVQVLMPGSLTGKDAVVQAYAYQFGDEGYDEASAIATMRIAPT